MKPSVVNYVIYHSPCNDGDTGAMIAKRFFKEKSIENVIFHATSIGKPLPNDIEGKNILLIDFAYPKDILQKLISLAKEVLILDHHKTNMEDLNEIPSYQKVFNMELSGATLAWNYFYPEKPVPLLVKMIEDRDLWKKNIKGSDDLSNYLYAHPSDFDLLESLLDENNLEGAISKGIAFRELNNFYVDNFAKWATIRFMQIKDQFYLVAHSDCGIASITSDLGACLLKNYPIVDFAAVYYINNYTDGTSFSLRSTDKNTDVSQIAKHFNGGGHRNASGLKVSYTTNHLPGIMIDNNNLVKIITNIYFDKIKDYNVVYLMSNTHKEELSKYLLQDRASTIQTCMAIGNKDERCALAIIWDYNPSTNKSYYTITIDTNLSNEDKQKIRLLFGKDLIASAFEQDGCQNTFFI